MVSGLIRRKFNLLTLALFLAVFSSGVFLSMDQIVAKEGELSQSPDNTAYLELSVNPMKSPAGSLITLHISYHNLGMPHTTINVKPSNLVEFEPPISMPCKFDQHLNGCRAITFRTLEPGEVEFTAFANGEVWDEDCQCWYWGTASDTGPAIAAITDPWLFFFPFVMD